MERRRLLVSLLVLVLGLGGVVAVPSVQAAEQEKVSVVAPAGTTSVWLDIEAPNLEQDEVSVTLADGSVMPLSTTSFGVSSVAATSAGAFAIAIRSLKDVDVDVVVTFADKNGKVLDSKRERRTLTSTKPVKLTVQRYAGSDRYQTNIAVNKATIVANKPVFIATGADFPDALSIGPAVALSGGSLFLTSASGLKPEALEMLRTTKPSTVYIVGGVGAVPETVAQSVRKATGETPIRLSGANRYATSAKVFETFFAARTIDFAFIATGRNYPDALSAASAGGALGAPVLLVDGTSAKALDAASSKLLATKKPGKVLVAGGEGAVNANIARSLSRSYDVTRLSGTSRYGTSLAVNNFVTQQTGVPITQVWVATGKNFPDALSAAAPAGASDKRLVLSDGSCIPQEVLTSWIKTPGSKVSQVKLVGSTGVLSPTVASLTPCSKPTK